MRCAEILSYTVPMYGNKRIFPYGWMRVLHGDRSVTVPFGKVDEEGFPYITVNGKQYRYRNEGSLYSPKFTFLNQSKDDEEVETVVIELPKGAEMEFRPGSQTLYLVVPKGTEIQTKTIEGRVEPSKN